MQNDECDVDTVLFYCKVIQNSNLTSDDQSYDSSNVENLLLTLTLYSMCYKMYTVCTVCTVCYKMYSILTYTVGGTQFVTKGTLCVGIDAATILKYTLMYRTRFLSQSAVLFIHII